MSNQLVRIMSSRGLAASIGISFAIQIAVGGTALAGGFADCVRNAASEVLVAKTEFQHDLRSLIVQKRPDFELLATVSMELQFLLAEARRAKFDYLLGHDPNRIDTTNGLAQFSNFEWSDEDGAKFMEKSSSYRELEHRISTQREQNDGHSDWPKLREYFRSELNQSQDFKALMARFQTRQSNVEAMIEQCHHD